VQGIYFKPGKITESLVADFGALVRRKNAA
jgi:hypothetical protein